MRTFKLKAICIATAAALFLSVTTHAQSKMSKMKKDTTKMSKMDHQKTHGKMDKVGKSGKMDKMKKDTSKM
ncbi:hypothetical protein ACFQZX_00165 [Mucilaginibacter litoreus]|uniref:Pentapeptide MXKDX repeat protein n=1 Tax=Mucilaginibacter litoreus TaxID=1048221 RepID=A0ABW3AP28_9SPHI